MTTNRVTNPGQNVCSLFACSLDRFRFHSVASIRAPFDAAETERNGGMRKAHTPYIESFNQAWFVTLVRAFNESKGWIRFGFESRGAWDMAEFG